MRGRGEFPLRARLAILVLVALLLQAFGCAFVPRRTTHGPVLFGEDPGREGPELSPSWPAPPAIGYEALKKLEGPYQVLKVEEVAAGTTGVEKVHRLYPLLGYSFKLKSKKVPPDLDGINNAPRKELAAYALQRLFLDAADYVVPTTHVHCMPVERWRSLHDGEGEPTLEGTSCVLVASAFWLGGVTVPDSLYELERFVSDPSYARFLSNFNVFTYLVDHRDGRDGNFLVSKDDARRQVFAIDNGSTFGPLAWNYFVMNWNEIRVSAVRQETIGRLRILQRKDLDFLQVVMQLEAGEDGVLRLVPSGPALDPRKGAQREGGTVQFGLTEGEVDDVWRRIQKLIGEVDKGALPVF